MVVGGYAGRILNVDLTKKEFHFRELADGTARKYLGGIGLAAKILWDDTAADTDPLSPEAPLIFMVGPLTGTAMPSSSRYIVAGISPLTGIWGEAHSGGSWADELTHAGFDGIVVKGRAEKPVYLWLHDGIVDIRDATHLWGMDTYEVDDVLKSETDRDASVATIGPAGEKMVRIACIMNDGRMGRAAARCGFGAVMGSKNLKAIVVRGTRKLDFSDEKEFKRIVARIYALNPPKKVQQGSMSVEGSVARWNGFMESGRIPVKNFQQGTFEPTRQLILGTRHSKPYFCRHCSYGCIDSRLTPDGTERHMVIEHWAPVGTNCLIGDSRALQEAYILCQKYGMDSISVGGVLAFAMECYEKGLITRKDTDGVDLNWGNEAAMLEMVRRIGEKEGFGSLLGEGTRRAAERIGGISREYAMHVKGLEFPLHDPRTSTTLALQYATGSGGAFHVEAVMASRLEKYGTPLGASEHSYVVEMLQDLGYPVASASDENRHRLNKGLLVAKTQDLGSILNSLVVCMFAVLPDRVTVRQLMDLTNSVTGWGIDLDEFMRMGERISNLKRLINVRKGLSRKNDVLPGRMLTLPRREIDAPDSLPHLGAMLSEYYSSRGWSEEGVPSEQKLVELNLEECQTAKAGT
ncbi:MAG: aldehyde ferredoxin oxidoreductase family protein [Chloroflexi bacterium]|nr:aldehyde ferredoxin oxidoreductase family protein [Chloroflexota bacterium]